MSQKGGLMAVGKQVDERYHVHIVMQGFSMTSDDYHATVTRLSDDAQLVFVNKWKWVLKWRIRRRALDREFKRYDKRKRKLSETEDLIL